MPKAGYGQPRKGGVSRKKNTLTFTSLSYII